LNILIVNALSLNGEYSGIIESPRSRQLLSFGKNTLIAAAQYRPF